MPTITATEPRGRMYFYSPSGKRATLPLAPEQPSMTFTVGPDDRLHLCENPF